MVKISSPNISLDKLISFMLTKIECIQFSFSSCIMLLCCNEKREQIYIHMQKLFQLLDNSPLLTKTHIKS